MIILNTTFFSTNLFSLNKTDHVKSEKEILSAIKHPFIVRLYWTHHSDQFLYMLFDYLPGGELFSYMRRRGTFDLKTALFYICEIVLAFEYLHSLQIIYRKFIKLIVYDYFPSFQLYL